MGNSGLTRSDNIAIGVVCAFLCAAFIVILVVYAIKQSNQKCNYKKMNASSEECAAKYGQCGGSTWEGATCCKAGSYCSEQSTYYSQCLPDSSTSPSPTGTGTPSTKPIKGPSMSPRKPGVSASPHMPHKASPSAHPGHSMVPPPSGSYAGARPAPLALLSAQMASPGYNIAGFDSGNPQKNCTPSGFWCPCADPSSADWDSFFVNSDLVVIRLPVQPARIMTSIPTSATDQPSWCGAFTSGSCPGGYTNADVGDYIGFLKTFLTNYPTKFFILDVHNNNGHLGNPLNDGSTPFNVDNLLWFWQRLSDYINTEFTVEQSSRIIFELFNEPTGGQFTNKTYAVTQMNIVKYLRQQNYPNIALVTTWGNFSKLQKWGPTSSGGDGSLVQLVDAITSAFGSNASALNTGTLIVYHQYCDNEYSGTEVGCASSFTSSLWNTWISDSKAAIAGTGLAFCQTEGNVMAGDESCSSIKNGDSYQDFLSDTTTGFGPQLKFFTLWQTNQFGVDTGYPSSAIWGNYNGIYSNNINSYGCIFSGGTNSGWVSSSGVSALNNQKIPTLKW